MQTCQFITFGKHLPTASRSFTDRFRFDPAARPASAFDRQPIEQNQQLRLLGGTENGTSTVLCEYQPNVTPSNGTQCVGRYSADSTLKRNPVATKSTVGRRGVENDLVEGDEGNDVVGTSYFRSVSVPPRLDYRSNVYYSQSGGKVADGSEHISPPRMKRRKKKGVSNGTPEPQDNNRLNGITMRPSSGCDKSRSPLASKRVPLTPDSAVELCENMTPTDESNGNGNGNVSKSSSSNEQFADTSDSGKSSDAATSESCKYIEWNGETHQSTPDPCSDGDADSKESGYITLEDLRVKLGSSGGRSSWSSEERAVGGCSQATDQDIGGFSSGDERRPELLSTRRSAAARLPALECFDSILSSMCSGFGIGSSGAVVPVDESDCCGRTGSFGGGSGLTPTTSSSFFECRSAPPTCDSSVLRFTFTVRLDSKMFRRRMIHSVTRQRSPIDLVACTINSGKTSPTLTLVANVGRKSPEQVFSFPIGGPPLPIVAGRMNVTLQDSAVALRRSVQMAPSTDIIPNISPSCSIGKQDIARPLPPASNEDFDDGDGHAPPPPKSSINSASSAVSRPESKPESVKLDPLGSSPKSPFVGEKVIVRAEVHRSADMLDTEVKSSANNRQIRLTTCGVQTSPANVGFIMANKTTVSPRNDAAVAGGEVADENEETCLIRCLESTSNYTTTLACSQSQPHSKSAMWNSFHGCVRHVNVDRIVDNSCDGGKQHSKHRSQENSVANSRTGNGHNSVQVAAQTMKKSVRKSGTTTHRQQEVRTRSSCGRRDDSETSRSIQPSGRREVSQGRRKNATNNQDFRVRGRKVRRRFGSADSSSMSSDCAAGGESDNELCSPCIHSPTTPAVMTASCCNSHAMRSDSRCLPTAAVSATSSNTVITGNGNGGTSNRKQVRRSIRQFFRVENLFACRLHHNSEKDASVVNERSEVALGEGRREGERESEAICGGGNGSCLTPTDAAPRCRGGGNSSGKWFSNESRCVQRSVSGRSPSTSAVERRSRHRSSRRAPAITKSSVNVQPSSPAVVKNAHHGSSRSASPPLLRQGSRCRCKHVENDDEGDDRMARRAATMSRQCSTSNGCRGCRCGDGSTMPVGHRKTHRDHRDHHRVDDVVDGTATMAASSGASGHRQHWVNVVVDSGKVQHVDDGQAMTSRRRKHQTTPAVTPMTPSTPGDDLVLTPGAG